MPKNLGNIKVERQGNETLKLGVGTGSKSKSGGTSGDLGYITVDRTVKKPPTKSPAK